MKPGTEKIKIGTIEGCAIWLQPNGDITFVAKAAVDNDGTGGNPEGDPYHQNETSLRHNGKSLNAETERYIVTPPFIIHNVSPIVLGCQCWVFNPKTGITATGVVGDIGPWMKIGEISVAMAKKLEIRPSPVNGGEDEHIIQYRIRPGTAANVDGVQYDLQASKT